MSSNDWRDNATDQTELEYQANECAEYIMMRLEQEILSQDNLSMWISDHFAKYDN